MVTATTIKKGYKQIELGGIPEDWEINILKGIVEKNRIPSGIYKEKSLYGSGTKIIKLGDVFGGDYFEPHNAQRVSLNRKELLNNQVYVGDIIISLASVKLEGVGKVMYVKKLDEETAFDHNVALIRANKDCDSEYIFYYLKSDKIRDVIRQLSTQVGTTFLKSSTIQEFNILLPPTKQEQTAIATALSDTDVLIEHLEKLIAKKKNIKQGAMQQLLTAKKRLPGFSGEWEAKKLGEIGKITGAGIDKKSNPDEVPARLVNYLDVFHKDFIYSKDLNHWVTAPITQAKRCAVTKGDIFFTPSSEMRYDIGISAVAMEDIPDAGYSYHVDRLRLFDDWDLAFRTYIFKTKNFLDQADTICEGSGKRYVISLQKFRKMTVKYPVDKSEQTAIATILSDMDAEIENLEQSRDKYTMLKQGMMQQLLTGRIRIHATN